MDKPIIVITGISGFLGSYVCRDFLNKAESEGFCVRGTVRDKNRADKIDPLKEAFGACFDKLELVEADLCNEASIIKACEGATYIIHTASPFPIEAPKNPEKEVIRPAVDGTLAVCKAAQACKAKRVVICSSIYAM